MSRSRRVGEGEHDEPEFYDDGAPRDGGGVGLWVVHVRVPADSPGKHRTPHPPSLSALLWDGVKMDGVVTAYPTSLSGLPQAAIVSVESSRCITNAFIITMSHDDTIVAECADRSAHGLDL